MSSEKKLLKTLYNQNIIKKITHFFLNKFHLLFLKQKYKKHNDKINVAKLVAGAPIIKKIGNKSITMSVVMNKNFMLFFIICVN